MTLYQMKSKLESLERARGYLMQALGTAPYYEEHCWANQQALEDIKDDISRLESDIAIYLYG